MSNVFVVIDCKKRKPILATPSARKATGTLKNVKSGLRVEVWDDHACVTIAYPKNLYKLDPYVQLEKQYIGRKQKQAEKRNKRRKRGK
jgi:hypothetical protein